MMSKSQFAHTFLMHRYRRQDSFWKQFIKELAGPLDMIMRGMSISSGTRFIHQIFSFMRNRDTRPLHDLADIMQKSPNDQGLEKRRLHCHYRYPPLMT